MNRRCKFYPPTAEEIQNGYSYTAEEQARIDKAKVDLLAAEKHLHQCNQLWGSMLTLRTKFNVLRASRLVSRAKWERLTAYKAVRAAQHEYWSAVHPTRLLTYRTAREFTHYTKDRITQPSFAKRSFLPRGER